jgi:hypothetical protein
MAALAQPLIVVFNPEEIDLLLFNIPITSNTIKASCTIVKGVGHDTNLGFSKRDKLPVEKGICHARMLSFLKKSEVNYKQVCKRKTSSNKNAQNVKDVSAS